MKTGDKVKLIFADRNVSAEVLEADKNSFSINLPDEEKVFVYGTEVNDFRLVDYLVLTTHNTSATQELMRMVTEMQQQNEKLNFENATFKSDISKIKAQLGMDVKAEK